MGRGVGGLISRAEVIVGGLHDLLGEELTDQLLEGRSLVQPRAEARVALKGLPGGRGGRGAGCGSGRGRQLTVFCFAVDRL